MSKHRPQEKLPPRADFAPLGEAAGAPGTPEQAQALARITFEISQIDAQLNGPA